MTFESSYTIEQDAAEDYEDKVVVKRDGVLSIVLCRLSQFWPVRFAMGAFRRKRLGRVSRILLAILPRRMQRALGYPVCTSIGCSVSPEVRVSPTKPCGKGNKRKQDDLYEEDEQTWVEALTQELADDDESSVDPDFEPSAVETDSEEYHHHNDTESDLELSEKGEVVIEDVQTDIP
ncbi:hypothetical protein DPEC_G00268110 [Dallia pectoralis]|uniref:Uncharacterized protein n=1 Tax=Dallia pectoralis TaxID=75939 RepID=A0ACC2FP60_DALPE|nr:hypothetical protein DPEC_G00268110 [Dallia pectoralis]